MADGGARAASRKRNGRSGPPNQLPTERKEVMMLNRYAKFMAFISMAVHGLGVLALTWSTVVLLGGYVTALGKNEFWCLTIISMIQAARSVALSLPPLCLAVWAVIILPMLIALPFALVFLLVSYVYVYGPLTCLVLSSWRLGKRNYGSTDGADGKANMLPAALDMFYSLVIFQGILFWTWHLIDIVGVKVMVLHFQAEYPLSGKWVSSESIREYSDTRDTCSQKLASIKGRNLINYAVGLLGSESPEEYLSGARLLAAIAKKKGGEEEQVRQVMLCSRPKIQKLIDTLRWRSSSSPAPDEKREMRELAATILSGLAGDIDLAQYPGAIHCITSLFQEETTTKTYWNGNQVPHASGDGDQEQTKQAMMRLRRRAEEDILARYYLYEWMKEAERRWLKWLMKGLEYTDEVKQDQDDGGVQLILQGLAILEGLASGSGHQQNCMDICSAPGLLSKIMAPIHSNTLIQDVSSNGAWADVVNGSFKVLHRLISVPSDTSRTLRLEISSDHQAVSNLLEMMILDEVHKGGAVVQKPPEIVILDEVHKGGAVVQKPPEIVILDEVHKGGALVQKSPEIVILDEVHEGGALVQEPPEDLMLISTNQRRELQMRAMEILIELYVHLTPDERKELINNLLRIFVFLPDDGKDKEGDASSTTMLNLKATAGRNLLGLLLSTDTDAKADVVLACVATDGQNIVPDIIGLLEGKNNIIYRIIAAKILENLCTCSNLEESTATAKVLTPKLSKEPPTDACTGGLGGINCDDKGVDTKMCLLHLHKEKLMPKVRTEMLDMTIKSPESETPDKEAGFSTTLLQSPIAILTHHIDTWERIMKNIGEIWRKCAATKGDEESLGTCAVQGHKAKVKDNTNNSSGDHQRRSSSGQENESETATRELQEAILSLVMVILCGEGISAHDLDDKVVAKLKDIVDENKGHAKTSGNLRIVKLCGQIAVLMMQGRDVKHNQHFQEFNKSLSEASKTMSGLESSILFSGTDDLRMKKTVKPLATLAREVQQLVG
ncbi:hypothetical protein U9M48_040994 [Paspalum notatum var. saurae]|uniref:Uncharacterized protein n=1 Tax=Paspalum notatum var. saurae TaxID=547442 RepID=A0AAQ3XEC6_PASNO